MFLRALWKGKRSRFGLPVMGASLLVRSMIGRQPAVNLLLHYLFLLSWCSGDAVYQHRWIWLLPRQSKRGWLCSCGFGWRAWWNEARGSFSVVFFQPSGTLQEAFKFNTLICKRILFWLCRRRWLSIQADHQTDWRLLSGFFPSSWIPCCHQHFPLHSALLWKWRNGWEAAFLSSFQSRSHPLAAHISLQPLGNLIEHPERLHIAGPDFQSKGHNPLVVTVLCF